LTVFALALLMIAGRAGGFSTTWTAPPPMTAPPQVQAHNFAKAILTDISRTLLSGLGGSGQLLPSIRGPTGLLPTHAKDWFKCKGVNH
jgi:hypothetical protein